MAAYQIENISTTPIYENLDLPDIHGKQQVLRLGVREKQVLNERQWNSKAVQKHILRGRLRSKTVADPA